MDRAKTADRADETGEEPSGPAQYLTAGETLLKYAENIGIKKFYFTAYLTNKRLFFIDRDEKRPGVTAKEIPLEAIADCILETPDGANPVLAVSVKTSDDEIRIMKLIFYEDGEDRTPEMAEWIRLIRQGPKKTEEKVLSETAAATIPVATSTTAGISPQSVTRAPLRADTEVPASARGQVSAPLQPEQDQDFQEVPVSGDRTSRTASTGREQRPQAQVKPHKVTENTIEEPPARPVVMFCHHCGKKIPPNANFCPFCGTKMHSPVEEEAGPYNDSEQGEKDDRSGIKKFLRR